MSPVTKTNQQIMEIYVGEGLTKSPNLKTFNTHYHIGFFQMWVPFFTCDPNVLVT